MLYSCCEDRRKDAVRKHPTLNGIDYLELSDDLTIPTNVRLRTLSIYCIKPLDATTSLGRENVKIEGGERIRDITVTSVSVASATQPNLITIQVNKTGDFSTYTLRLLPGISGPQFDPLLTTVDFTFKTAVLNDFDCQISQTCTPEMQALPEINYMAKDFASFRTLMLDRLNALMPRWTESSPADLGVMLVELLAYVGDYLSYQQDVIATEAYLGTARRRVSVRRHARLLDYFIFEGSNARTWLQIIVNADLVRPPGPSSTPILPRATTRFLTQVDWLGPVVAPDSTEYNQALSLNPTIFEPLYDINELYEAHNELHFYTWGARECCLPTGSTKATLSGHYQMLKAGDVLIFEEVYGPYTGVPEDADLAHRCAVRLTKVTPAKDPLGKLLLQPNAAAPTPTFETLIIEELEETREVTSTIKHKITENAEVVVKDAGTIETVEITEKNVQKQKHGEIEIAESAASKVYEKETTQELKGEHASHTDYSLPITEIEWHSEDALTFSLCISTTTAPEHGLQYIENVSVALGNIVLADHGLTMHPEDFAPVPEPSPVLFKVPTQRGNRCSPTANIPVLPRYYPSLKYSPLTFVGPAIERYTSLSANATINWASMHSHAMALPAIQLTSSLPNEKPLTWQVQPDLLQCEATSPAFVAEIESDGTVYLRFGDGRHGMFPEPQTQFTATYRTGSGVAGNIGADSLVHIASNAKHLLQVRNPLPAKGGMEPESVEDVRQKASSAFLTQERAVTTEDYVTLAQRDPTVKRAAAVQRWTGSWFTIFLAVEPVRTATVNDAYKLSLSQTMQQYCLAGSDLVIVGPVYVSLEIEMHVQVKDDSFRNGVTSSLQDVFSNRLLPGGERGYFYPDNFSFGQTIYISPLRSAALAVPGVSSVEITVFQRQGLPDSQGLNSGTLTMDWLEIARLENDRNFQEHGIFRLYVEGGK